MRSENPRKPQLAKITCCIIGVMAVAALAIGPLHLSYSSYDHRNGAAEALDDVMAGRPIKFYYRAHNQIDVGFRTPGIFCPKSLGKIDRVELADAAFSEGRGLDWLNFRRATSARAFAYLYNSTVLIAHRSELQQVCPGIRQEPYEMIHDLRPSEPSRNRKASR